MFERNQYELIDFGGGRKLERFGAFVLDRPCPTADRCQPSDPDGWERADARFQWDVAKKKGVRIPMMK